MTEVTTPLRSLAEGDLHALDSNEAARILATASVAELNSAFDHPDLRKRLLDEIFRRMQLHVRPERIGPMNALVHWQITGGSGPDGYDHYRCLLADGACTVTAAPAEDPRVRFTVSPTNLVRMIVQREIPAVLFITDDLKVDGDLGFATGLMGYFDLPTGFAH